MKYAKSANFDSLVGRAGLTKAELSRLAGISVLTFYKNPRHRPVTAWKVARAYAQAAGISEDEAFEKLFKEDRNPKSNPDYAFA